MLSLHYTFCLLVSDVRHLFVYKYLAKHTQPFYAEDAFTHLCLSWSSIIPYLLPPSIVIHGILSVQMTVFSHNLSKFSLVYLLACHTPLHTPYILHPIIVFFLHHMPIALHLFCCSTEIMSSNPNLSLNPLLGSLSCSLVPHIHLTILISAC